MTKTYKLDFGNGAFVIYRNLHSCFFSTVEDDVSEEEVGSVLRIEYTDILNRNITATLRNTPEKLADTAKLVSAQADEWLKSVNRPE